MEQNIATAIDTALATWRARLAGVTATRPTVNDPLLDNRDMHRELEEIRVQLDKIEASLNRANELLM